jgi:hypothetical protein
MIPGLSETDCQVAKLHYRQLVKEGQRQQLVARMLQESAVTRATSNPIHQFGTIVVSAGHRLQGLLAATRQRLDTAATTERRAIA